MVQQSFDQISSFLETLFFHLSARFYGHLILTMPIEEWKVLMFYSAAFHCLGGHESNS